MKKNENEKDIIVRMVAEYRKWYQKRVGVPVQYSSQQAYVIEYNTMKGIYNMLVGSYRAKNPTLIPGDNIVLEMWQHLLEYLKEKNNYYFMTLGSIHRSYNTIVAQMSRHIQKQKFAQQKAAADEAQQKFSIIQDMMKS
ncbi:MAG: hypothetical protein IKQ70_00210 [Bacteroidales bacterium]|nr:hypothetical protein [Bacteroidales bacterium]